MVIVDGVVTAVAVALLAVSCMPYLPRGRRLLDLASHFPLQVAIGAGFLLCMIVALRVSGPATGFALLAYVLSVAPLFPYLRRGPATATQNSGLRVLFANVFVKNQEPVAFEALIRATAPDIVGAAEVNGAFAQMFATLRDVYPYQYVYPEDQASTGIALLARQPVEGFERVALAPGRFTLMAKTGGVHVTVFHAANPTYDFATREAEFAALAAYPVAGPRVIVGDFNATPYCRSFATLCRALGLQQARRGRGVLGTWPVAARVSWLRIPIDHVLVGGGVRVEGLRLGSDIGSDHLPLISEIKF